MGGGITVLNSIGVFMKIASENAFTSGKYKWPPTAGVFVRTSEMFGREISNVFLSL
jgi:hypothetical protein